MSIRIHFNSRAEIEATDQAFLELANEISHSIDDPDNPLDGIQESLRYLKTGAENDLEDPYGFDAALREATVDWRVIIMFRESDTLETHLSRLTALEADHILSEYNDETTITERQRTQSQEWDSVQELLEDVSNAVTTMRESTVGKPL